MSEPDVPILDAACGQARRCANAGLVLYAPRATFGPRVQQEYQLVLVHAGHATVRVDGHERRIPAGHVGLLLPGRPEFFAFARDCQTRHSWMALAPRALEQGVRHALDTAVPCLPISGAMQTCMDLALAVEPVDEPAHRPVLVAVAHAALRLYLAEATRLGTGGSTGHPAVSRAQAIARLRAAEGTTVSDLAREVGLSPEHLIRLFARETGRTPGTLLREERLARGVYLLENTGLSVAEAAHRSGFASPHHFARAVRAATGMTPSALRARRWVAGDTPAEPTGAQQA